MQWLEAEAGPRPMQILAKCVSCSKNLSIEQFYISILVQTDEKYDDDPGRPNWLMAKPNTGLHSSPKMG